MTSDANTPPKKPWFAGESVRYLEKLLRPEFIAYEWGAGGSTMWFAKRVSWLISVEHESEWYDDVLGDIKHFDARNVNLVYVAMEDGEHDYDDYAKHILRYKDESFDVISVDGRNRVECIKYAIPKLRPKGIMVLDNSERIEYQPAVDLMNDWERHDFSEPSTGECTTTIWIKPSENQSR